MEVQYLAQIKDYCKTFHLINNGNKAKAKYDMGGKSLHNWLPKLYFHSGQILKIGVLRVSLSDVVMSHGWGSKSL